MTQSKVPGPNLGSVTITGTVTEQQAQTAGVATTWTSATALNTTTATYAATNFGTANVGIRVPTTTTAGAVTIEVSQDGTDWMPAGAVRQDNSFPENPVALAYLPGTNGTRVYALSIDAFTLIRVRLSTVIVGAGNVVVTISAVAGGIEPFVAQRSRKVATYRAVYRATARPYTLGNTFVANTRKQMATIHHAAASTRLVRLRRVLFTIMNNTAATQFSTDLVRITTAPATGNPAVTPSRAETADAVADATCLAMPTTAATEEAQVFSTEYGFIGISGGANAGNPQPMTNWYDLLAPNGSIGGYDDEAKLPTIRPGVLEGWSITVDSNAATTISFMAIIEFTEEAA